MLMTATSAQAMARLESPAPQHTSDAELFAWLTTILIVPEQLQLIGICPCQPCAAWQGQTWSGALQNSVSRTCCQWTAWAPEKHLLGIGFADLPAPGSSKISDSSGLRFVRHTSYFAHVLKFGTCRNRSCLGGQH